MIATRISYEALKAVVPEWPIPWDRLSPATKANWYAFAENYEPSIIAERPALALLWLKNNAQS